MFSAICTLFEGDYHYGVASLVNSLIDQGFCGPVYAGYKGSLPQWALAGKEDQELNWPGATTLNVTDNLQLHFLPITSNYHLTNYKPDFMIGLLADAAKNADAMFYFDPDIQVIAAWSFFNEWVSCGVALAEDVNSPLTNNHPRRVAWRRYYKNCGIALSFKNSIYANGGFVGVSRDNEGFLQQWKIMQEEMAAAIGGLGISIFSRDLVVLNNEQEPFDAFGRTDQDALNAAVEAWDGEYSFIGKEAMGFGQGTCIIPHALGSPKPWRKNIIANSLAGHPLRLSDRTFWQNINTNIITHSKSSLKKKRLAMMIAAFIGRFYSRGTF